MSIKICKNFVLFLSECLFLMVSIYKIVDMQDGIPN